MFLGLGPVNVASLFFAGEPGRKLIAVQPLGGVAVSIAVPIRHRGFSRLVSGGHVLFWAPLVLLLIFALPVADGVCDIYLWILLAANASSLVFDINDLRLWLGGDRRVLGHDRSIRA